MRGVLRYLAALIAMLCLLAAALLSLFCCMTTEPFAREVNATADVRLLQQERIDAMAAELSDRWQLSPEVLAQWTQSAAQQQGEVIAIWWGSLWQDASADAYMPMWLSAADEGELVAEVRADAGFIACTPETQRRAIARDEVAYALDEAICDAVTPLRRSIIDMALSIVAEAVPLSVIRLAALIAAVVLTVIALVLLLLARKAAGSALVSAGLAMEGLTVPVWLADVPGMLAQLSDIAALQGRNALTCMAVLWYGAAAALIVTGWIIIAVKGFFRRDEA